MKPSKNLALVMALLAVTVISAAFLGGCSEEKSSNPITSADNPTIDVYFRDSLTSIDSSMVSEESSDGREVPTAAAASWNYLSAMNKRQLILQAAWSENGWQTSYNCKTWAQHIVRKASGEAASLPSTCPNAYGYYYCSASHVTQILQNQSASYTYFVPGRVLQMWYGGSNMPHTAIIWSSSSIGMQWIDCNFVGTGKVGIHYISWSDFYRKVPAYTLYEVY
jgi:hypothetical protein